MNPRRFALVGGIVMLVLGVMSLLPRFYYFEAASLPPLYLENSYGWFLGTFAMNIVNKVALILFGLTGIYASQKPTTSLSASVRWSRAVLYVMAPLTVLGLFPATNTLFGYWPLFSADAALHGVAAVVGAYFGFYLPRRAAAKVERLKAYDRPSRVA